MTMTSNLGRRVFQHGLVFTTAILACAALQAEEHDKHGSAAERFVHKATMGGEMEIEMGRLAQQKGQSQDVRSLGSVIARDHAQANEKLRQIAMAKNFDVSKADVEWTSKEDANRAATDAASPPVESSKTAAAAPAGHNQGKENKAHRAMSKLQSQSGQEFDRSFVRMAIKDHKKAILEFDRARAEVNDSEIRSFIDETLPKLRQHLQLSQTAARTVGVDESTIAADSFDDNTSAVGGAAAGTVGTRGSDKPSSPASKPDKDRSSLDNDVRLNGATDTDASGTIQQNVTSHAEIDANVGDRSINAATELDRSDRSVSAEVKSEKKGKFFQKGDGKVLGLSIDKNDGKFLGFIPDPIKKNRDHKHDTGIKVDAEVNGNDASVGGSATTEKGSGESK